MGHATISTFKMLDDVFDFLAQLLDAVLRPRDQRRMVGVFVVLTATGCAAVGSWFLYRLVTSDPERALVVPTALFWFASFGLALLAVRLLRSP